MDKRELLAKMVARGIDPSAVVVSSGGGGTGGFTGLDVAAMMAPLSKRESCLLRAKYCDDTRCLAEMWAYWFTYLVDLAQADQWRPKKPGVIDALSRVTLAEHISDNLCPDCLGVRRVHDRDAGRWLECGNCGGSGRMYLRGRDVAQRLGFKNEGLKEPWRSRVQAARRTLVAWEDIAVSKMR